MAAHVAILAAAAVAGGSVGGASPDAGGGAGGAAYGAALRPRPVVRTFSVAPRRLRADRAPRVRVRIEEPGVRRVRVRIDAVRVATGQVVRVPGVRVPVGRTVRVSWPRERRLKVGHWRVRLHVVDDAGATLARRSRRDGIASLVVVRAPKRRAPKPVAPPVAPAPAPAPVPLTDGVFPVAGPFTYGDGFGAARNGHTHEGQDLAAAEGTPVVAPTAGTILAVDYQRSAAGWYVVEQAQDGRAFFFAHCRTNTVTVRAGDAVAPGTQLCAVGHTGDASGPHLHFEIWTGAWRFAKDSRPIDPLPQLRAWQG